MTGILVFILVLGLLVAFHEFGHFIAAKACNVYVDRFSVGMPPRIFGIKIGETDYCIGALPLGGFVKMAGQEDAPLDDEQREKEYGHVPPDRWFNKKPVWQRYIIIIAGPFMNLVLAVLLYGIVAAVGQDVPSWYLSGRLGMIEEGSPASKAALYKIDDPENPGTLPTDRAADAIGWQTGDRVLSVGGQKVERFLDIAFTGALGGESNSHIIVLERRNPADDSLGYYACNMSPEIIEGDPEGMPRFGVAPFQEAIVDSLEAEFPAAAAGLEKGDIIEAANGQWVDTATFVKLTESTPVGVPIELRINRNGERLTKSIVPQTIGRIMGVAIGAPDETPEEGIKTAVPLVLGITDESKEKSGLQGKDSILEVNGQPATVELLNDLEIANPGRTLELKVLRPAILLGLGQKEETLTLNVPVDAVRAIGVGMGISEIFYRVPTSQIIPEAFKQSWQALERTVLTVKGLIFRDVSPKHLGGPVMIFTLVSGSAEKGIMWLLDITAFISINLCVLNLLPIPVLDGGLLVIHGIEGIRRKPLSAKSQERFAMVGIFFVVSLMLFVTYNDILRTVRSMLP